MKKFGVIVFVVAVLVGVVFANLFSFGRVSGKLFNVSFGTAIHGSGVAASDVRKVRDFTGVDVGGVFEVEIVAGRDFEVVVDADDNLLEHVKTEVNGNVLKISSSQRLKSDNPLRIRVSAPNIDSVHASGVTRVSVSGVKNKEMRVDTSGASKIKLDGQTASLSVEVSGASRVDAETLEAGNAHVDASGASHANVFVTGKLVSEASGASKISYTGNPTIVEKKTSGASKVFNK